MLKWSICKFVIVRLRLLRPAHSGLRTPLEPAGGQGWEQAFTRELITTHYFLFCLFGWSAQIVVGMDSTGKEQESRDYRWSWRNQVLELILAMQAH